VEGKKNGDFQKTVLQTARGGEAGMSSDGTGVPMGLLGRWGNGT